jgi:hypothetical protein
VLTFVTGGGCGFCGTGEEGGCIDVPFPFGTITTGFIGGGVVEYKPCIGALLKYKKKRFK